MKQSERDAMPEIRFFVVAFRRYDPSGGNPPVYKQAVVPAYNSLMAEAAGRAIAPDPNVSVWTSTINPPNGFPDAESARKAVRGEAWYSWIEKL
jgi:hypothetical protein